MARAWRRDRLGQTAVRRQEQRFQEYETSYRRQLLGYMIKTGLGK